ncbi:hypothetical protein Poly24_07060 [Rosistilla carotiformis]|uniref:Carboxypeptidase regulatory-like domain-containing protein n=1 Tax=Rosistilla carotiformis TaxID=2528017 RepID=A0A518JN85_9BACT|nr:hypothetical protein Poly24_07060 [Rosistilla carotiformis]
MFKFVLGLTCVSFGLGCSGSSVPETYPISGTVTYQGAPVADATITFSPTAGRPASGTTDDGGTFQLTTFDEAAKRSSRMV